MEKYILSIDQGTTSSRAILFNNKGEACFVAQKEFPLIYPKEDYVEAEAIEIYLSVLDCVTEVLVKADISWDSIDSIGITNQRETTIVWDKKTGKPIYNAIIWQSRQSASICDALEDKKDFIHERTGLLINPYFSASKIRFILDEVEGAQEKAQKGELLFGTIDTWIIYKLTKGKVHATDTTNANRTLLFNINTLTWDDELLNLFNIPKCMLPEIKASNADYGPAYALNDNVHILGVAGDQSASLFGHNCFDKGQCKNTYGTGCFMLMNIGEKPILSKKGLLTTVAWDIDGKVTYALEGSVFIGGAAIEWLKNNVHAIESSKDVDKVASEVNDTDGVYFVPAFVGLGTPYWDNDVRGTIFGFTRATTRAHIVRATLEAIAFQSKDVFDVMIDESGYPIPDLQVDGGATKSDVLMQFQSDILNIEIKKPCCVESTALGVAYLAGLKSGFFKSIHEIKSLHVYEKNYYPQMSEENRQKECRNWANAIASARSFKAVK